MHNHPYDPIVYVMQSFSLFKSLQKYLLYPFLLFSLVPWIKITNTSPQWMNHSQKVESTAVIFPAICSWDSSQLCIRLSTSPDAPSSVATWNAELKDLFAWHGCPEPRGTWMWMQRSHNYCSHKQMFQKWWFRAIHAGIWSTQKQNKKMHTAAAVSPSFSNKSRIGVSAV